MVDLVNPRIDAIQEKLAGFKFNMKYLLGKLNYLADALSRLPLIENFSHEEKMEWNEVESQVSKVTICENGNDPGLLEFYDEATKDNDYLETIEVLMAGTPL